MSSLPLNVSAQSADDVIDSLQSSLALPFQQLFFPHGFPVLVKSNDSTVIKAAEVSWGGFKQRFEVPPLEVRFVISESASRRPPVPVFRAQSNLMTMVADARNFACCDLAAGFGFAYLTKAAAAHKNYLRYYFLDAMVYTLLDTRHLVAVHAACVEMNGHGVLLVGDSGAGKSSLSYACTQRGWTYISDDSVSLVLHKTGRSVLGNPQTIRFRPSAWSLFPELKGRKELRNNKPTVEIETKLLRHIQTAFECAVDYIVFLNRQNSEPERPHLGPISREESVRRLACANFPEELSIQKDRSAAIQRLLDAEMYTLTYRQFAPAIDLLEQMAGKRN
jgi:HPr Serine kinase C-terminal domain